MDLQRGRPGEGRGEQEVLVELRIPVTPSGTGKRDASSLPSFRTCMRGKVPSKNWNPVIPYLSPLRLLRYEVPRGGERAARTPEASRATECGNSAGRPSACTNGDHSMSEVRWLM